MFSSLVWLFKEHRDLVTDYHDAQKNEFRLMQIIADLEDQLTRKPVFDATAMAEELFQDQPYEGGKIPDDVWLTPGGPDR